MEWATNRVKQVTEWAYKEFWGVECKMITIINAFQTWFFFLPSERRRQSQMAIQDIKNMRSSTNMLGLQGAQSVSQSPCKVAFFKMKISSCILLLFFLFCAGMIFQKFHLFRQTKKPNFLFSSYLMKDLLIRTFHLDVPKCLLINLSLASLQILWSQLTPTDIMTFLTSVNSFGDSGMGKRMWVSFWNAN